MLYCTTRQYVMRQQDTWWYNLDHLWLNYDTHWAMTRAVKVSSSRLISGSAE